MGVTVARGTGGEWGEEKLLSGESQTQKGPKLLYSLVAVNTQEEGEKGKVLPHLCHY